MQQSLTGLQQRCRTFEAAAGQQQALIEQLQHTHAVEVQGWREALEHAGTEYAALKTVNATQAAELGRLHTLLDASDGRPTLAVPAVVDEPERFTVVPDPAPVPAFRISDIPPGPVGGEAADVNARTQQTDVRSLRPAVLPVGPVYAPWGIRPDGVRPPLPDETPTVRQSAITAVLPVWDATITVPVELSKTTGDRARSKVRAAVGAAP